MLYKYDIKWNRIVSALWLIYKENILGTRFSVYSSICH